MGKEGGKLLIQAENHGECSPRNAGKDSPRAHENAFKEFEKPP